MTRLILLRYNTNVISVFVKLSHVILGESDFIPSHSPNFRRMKIEILNEYRDLIVPSYHSIFSH